MEDVSVVRKGLYNFFIGIPGEAGQLMRSIVQHCCQFQRTQDDASTINRRGAGGKVKRTAERLIVSGRHSAHQGRQQGQKERVHVRTPAKRSFGFWAVQAEHLKSWFLCPAIYLDGIGAGTGILRSSVVPTIHAGYELESEHLLVSQ